VLDNSPYEARLFLEGKTYGAESWENWCNEAKATALPGAKDFLQYADKLGIEIFYISNRKVSVFEPTLKNLQALNLPHADKDHLLLRTAESDKTERRNKVKEDYQVILYVGDNLTDYSEEYATRGADLGKGLVQQNKEELLYNFIMLPNPMYGEWESAIYNNDFSKSDEEKLKMRQEILDTKN
jgi:5'-nucleotidase (lipoprotein e(P4) family)